MYIRNREEALDALSAVLALPERREQIVQSTVLVMMCLDADARQFMVDSQAGLIEGGLEYMRRKRQEMVEVAPPAEEAAPGEPILIVDSSTDPLLEAVGSAMDALRLTEIVLQVFPEVKANHKGWEVARAIIADEPSMQEMLRTAVRERKGEKPEIFAQMQTLVGEKVTLARPAWRDETAKLRSAILGITAAADPAISPKANDPDLLFNIVAIDEQSATLVLQLLGSNPDDAHQYLRDVRDRVNQLMSLEQRNS